MLSRIEHFSALSQSFKKYSQSLAIWPLNGQKAIAARLK